MAPGGVGVLGGPASGDCASLATGCSAIASVTFSLAVLAAALAAQVAPPASRQGQEPVFRTGTRTVPVYVTVTDAEGRLVPDLGPDDFEIYDNGKLQTISIFASEIQPIMVVMMLDRSGSMVDNFRRVHRRAVRHAPAARGQGPHRQFRTASRSTRAPSPAIATSSCASSTRSSRSQARRRSGTRCRWA